MVTSDTGRAFLVRGMLDQRSQEHCMDRCITDIRQTLCSVDISLMDAGRRFRSGIADPDTHVARANQ